MELHRRLREAEQYTAETLLRATRLSQVISLFGRHADVQQTIARASIQIAEMFSADVVLFMLGPDEALRVEGRWGMRASDVPDEPVDVTGNLLHLGSDDEAWLPTWIRAHAANQVEWVRLQSSEQSLGFMLLIRCIDVPFTSEDRIDLSAIAQRVALAIENGRLHGRLEHLLARNVEIAEQERSLVALDMHDGPIQSLTVVTLKFDLLMMQLERGRQLQASDLAELRELLGHEIVSLRRLMTELRPPVLDERGLDAALRDSAMRVFEGSEIKVELTSDVDGARFAPATETILFRMTREALMNVRKHSEATRVQVRLSADDHRVSLDIRDDGIGFGAVLKVNPGHLGLVSLRELAESIGGDCSISSSPGHGVSIHAEVPRSAPASSRGASRIDVVHA